MKGLIEYFNTKWKWVISAVITGLILGGIWKLFVTSPVEVIEVDVPLQDTVVLEIISETDSLN